LILNGEIMATAEVNNVDNIGNPYGQFPSSILPHTTTLITLISGTPSIPGSALLYPFQKAGGTTQGAYQITSGKTFFCIGMYGRNNGTSSANYITLAQSTAAPTQGGAIGSPPAGSIFFNSAGSISSSDNIRTGGTVIPATGPTLNDVWIPLQGVQFTASYYPYWVNAEDSGDQISIRIVGYEQ
jgi:hypothetical protein